MSDASLLNHPTYDPNRFFDNVIEHMHLASDAALAQALEVAPPVISKMRHRRIPIGASMLIRIHEESGLNIKDLRELMGDRRKRVRISEESGDANE
jgi:D-serine deaminase-like pyridoxal phosphate-dependent protein